jgi:hypothetical protein
MWGVYLFSDKDIHWFDGLEDALGFAIRAQEHGQLFDPSYMLVATFHPNSIEV